MKQNIIFLKVYYFSNLQCISDLLLYQSFCFFKIAIYAQKIADLAKKYMYAEIKECIIAPEIELIKRFTCKNRLSSKDKQEYN